jgi:GNAT superfamily N-acetyltransferase
MITIRPTSIPELPLLKPLAVSSKTYWGYGQPFLDNWAARLVEPTPEDCELGYVRVAENTEHSPRRIIGYYVLGECALYHLFVEPDYIGKGVGGALLRDAMEQGRGLGMPDLEITSDPHVAAFYKHFGAIQTATRPSGGLELPILSLPLADDQASG